MSNFKFLLLPALMLLAGSAMAATGVITSISPNIGPESGGGTVVIRGSGFTGATKVVFTIGGSPAVVNTFIGTVADKHVSFALPASPKGSGAATVDIQDNTGTSLLAAANSGSFTYTSNQLVINAQATIASILSLTWGSTTVNDSAGTPHPLGNTQPYTWVIGSTSSADAGLPGGPYPTLNLSQVYKLSDDYTVSVKNTSSTGNQVELSVKSSDTASADWTVQNGVGPDQFVMACSVGNSPFAPLSTASAPIKNGANDVLINANAEAAFDLSFQAPSSITKGADSAEAITVTITGQKD